MPSIGKTNALFVATLPYPPGVRQCRKAAEAAARGGRNKLLFKSGLPEGHSINVDGEPQTYLLLSATKGKLKLQDVEDDTFSFNLFSCE